MSAVPPPAAKTWRANKMSILSADVESQQTLDEVAGRFKVALDEAVDRLIAGLATTVAGLDGWTAEISIRLSKPKGTP